jgi:hypothetical protein
VEQRLQEWLSLHAESADFLALTHTLAEAKAKAMRAGVKSISTVKADIASASRSKSDPNPRSAAPTLTTSSSGISTNIISTGSSKLDNDISKRFGVVSNKSSNNVGVNAERPNNNPGLNSRRFVTFADPLDRFMSKFHIRCKFSNSTLF